MMAKQGRLKERRIPFVIWLAALALMGIQQWSFASPIAYTWVKATVKIENEWGEIGTGFLVFREVKNNIGKTFLVTNKHIVG